MTAFRDSARIFRIADIIGYIGYIAPIIGRPLVEICARQISGLSTHGAHSAFSRTPAGATVLTCGWKGQNTFILVIFGSKLHHCP